MAHRGTNSKGHSGWRNRYFERCSVFSTVRARSHFLLALWLLLPFLLFPLIAPIPAHAGWLYLNKNLFGANESVVAELGQVDYITGCPAGGIDDFFYPWAGVYIVPKGSTALHDVSNCARTPAQRGKY